MSTRFAVVVVDDEPLARQRVEDLLAQEDDMQVVASCSDGRKAVESIGTLRPDLVFLDVRMPEMDGLEVVATLGQNPPAIIFVTAYDRYAIRAFELNALDYLLKPFDQDRFKQTLQRVRSRLRDENCVPLQKLQDLLQQLEPPKLGAQRLELRVGQNTVFVPLDEIERIESAGNYVIVHTAKGDQLERATMNEMLKRLPPEQFTRTHRQAIVNIAWVREIRSIAPREYRVILRDGAEVPLSRRYIEPLRTLIAGR